MAMTCLVAALLILTASTKLCTSKSVCQSISEGLNGDYDLEQINECYQCQGWYRIKEQSSSAGSVAKGDFSWCGASDDDYLQISFGQQTKVAGFHMTSMDGMSWVEALQIFYLDENGEESYATNRSGGNVFAGNADGVSQKEYSFYIPITTDFVRLRIKSYHVRPCLNIQFYSCDSTTKHESGKAKRSVFRANPFGKYLIRRKPPLEDCPLKVPDDCENLNGCFQYLKDEFGCLRCQCDEEYTGNLEGDITIDVLSRDTAEREYGFRRDPDNLMRNGVESKDMGWIDYPSGHNYFVPYLLGEEFEKWERERIEQAMQEMENATCMRFKLRTDEEYFLKFYRGSGCSSYIGNIRKSGGQPLSIGGGCAHNGIIQHEILHALGFWHEQSRSDRDDYIKIFEENIKPGRESNFYKRETNNLGSPYDFKSVMHYGNTAFTNNGEDTIQAIHDPELRLGQSSGMTQEDVNQVNALYECKVVETTRTVTTTPVSTTTRFTTTTPQSTATTTTTTPMTTTTPVRTTPDSLCVDKLQTCESWKSSGSCTAENRWFMEMMCQKSCGLCVIQPPESKCVDKLNCFGFKDLCQDELVQNFISEYCPHTCSKC